MKVNYPVREIYITLYESECDVAEMFFMSKLVYFHEGSENKAKSEYLALLLCQSVISGLFYARYLH